MNSVAAYDEWVLNLERHFDLTESPIERSFLAGASMLHGFYFAGLPAVWAVPPDTREMPELIIAPQMPVGPYRIDFAILVCPDISRFGMSSTERPFLRVAVECDGHDFHERTKNQAKRDRSRDRALQGFGWHVMRFTGSEIHADLARCYHELNCLIGNWWEVTFNESASGKQSR